MNSEPISILIMDKYEYLKIISISSWPGIGYVGKRKHISLLSTLPRDFTLEYPGIYFLLGKDIITNKTKLYVGESDELITRLKHHARDSKKIWFEDFIIFSTTNGSLNKAHIKYIEGYFIDLIKKEHFNSFFLDNTCVSSIKKRNNLQYIDANNAQKFRDKFIFILKHLNLIDLDNPSPKPIKKSRAKKINDLPKMSNPHKINANTTLSNNNPLIFFKTLPNQPKHLQAKMIISNNKYILLKDSYIMKIPRKSFITHSKAEYNNWLKIIQNQCKPVKNNSNCLITTIDITFNSPSTAATMVSAGPSNGRIEWKLEDGTTLKEYQNNNSKLY